MNDLVQKELCLKRICESCDFENADQLLVINNGCIIGLFHVCKKCGEGMEFQESTFEFIPKGL